MLLNCDSHCCEQMVGGSSSKSCHRQQNCSLSNNLDLANEASRSCPNSPEHNDQNRISECQLITQNQNKGTKRRNDTIEGPTSVVLSSVSTNVTHQQHQTSQQKSDGGSVSMAPQTDPEVVPTRCSGDKCTAYSSPPPQEHAQSSYMDTSGPKPGESMEKDGGDEGCESCCDAEDYDYESILTKILNEKKLALSKSPEVIDFLQQISRSKETGTKTERETSQ